LRGVSHLNKVTMTTQRIVRQEYKAIHIERIFDVSYDALTRGLESLMGRMDPSALHDLPASSPGEARRRLMKFVGPSGFAIFQEIHHGALLRAFGGRPGSAKTYVFGNALIAIEMTTHVAEAGLYVPLRMFVEEVAPARVRVIYDLPSSQLGQFNSAVVDEVARDLDAKVERLLTDAARDEVAG
jgi:hypothetical protein